jgi:hypothetical protein
MQEVKFYSKSMNSPVIMSIYECYKYIAKEKVGKDDKQFYTVNAISPDGLKLTKKLNREDYEYFPCRIVDY